MMRRTSFLLLLWLVVIGVGASRAQFEKYQGQPIKEINITGNTVIETATIRFLIHSKVGDPLSLAMIRDDLQRIYKAGFFEDVVIDAKQTGDGITVTFGVVEKPILKSYQITGNDKLAKNTLEDAMKEKNEIKVPSVYDPVKINQAAQAIRDKYVTEGYSYITVTPLTKKVSDKEITITFAVNEGEKVWIRSIKFRGADGFNPGNRLWGLKSAMKGARERWWLSWLTGGGKYTKEKLQESLGKLAEFYQAHGYANVSIGEPEAQIQELRRGHKQKKVRKIVDIVIPIHEGKIYRFGEIKVEGNALFETELLTHLINNTETENLFGGSAFSKGEKGLIPGKTYNGSLVKKVIEHLTELYGSRGHIYANIFPEVRIDDEQGTAAITFKIREGEETRLHRLEFKGNNRTRDKVLRREIPLAEGDVFNTVAFKNGLAKLNYLGYLKDIEPDVKPTTEDPTNLDVNVALNDQHQTEIQLSGGYSSADKLFGMLSLGEHNLFGRGQELNFTVNTSKLRRTFSLRFTDEYVFDTENYGSIGVWNTENTYPSAKDKTIGGSIFAGRRLISDIYGRLGYSFQVDRLYDVTTTTDTTGTENSSDNDWSDWENTEEDNLAREAGTTRTSSITEYVMRDRRDNRREPTRGAMYSLTVEYAGGFLAGDNYFYRYEAEASWYTTFGNGLVLATHGEIDYADGYSGRDLPYFKRYFLGGAQTVRGYAQNSIGPKNSSGVNIGGNKALVFNSELVIPIAGPLKTVFFFDSGDSYRHSARYDVRTMRSSVGFELRFYVPAFWVPIRFIWGYKLDRYRDEPATDFQFTLGTFF